MQRKPPSGIEVIQNLMFMRMILCFGQVFIHPWIVAETGWMEQLDSYK